MKGLGALDERFDAADIAQLIRNIRAEIDRPESDDTMTPDDNGVINPEHLYLKQAPVICQLDHLLADAISELQTRADIFHRFHHYGEPLITERETDCIYEAARYLAFDLVPMIRDELHRLKGESDV